MEFDRVDLSPLDPLRDPPRWQSLVDATLARVDVALEERARRQDDALVLIASWRRTLLVAAAVLLAVLIPLEIALEVRESRAEAISRLASVSAAWVSQGQTPTGTDILRAISVEDSP